LDYKAKEKVDNALVRSSFWRSVRSAFGWHVVEKLQWIALITLSNVPKSSILLHFGLYFSWLIGGVPIGNVFRSSMDDTLEGNQYVHSIGIGVGLLNLNAVIFFAIFFAVCALIFITTLFPDPIGNEGGIMTNRAHYVMIRATQLLYPGILGVSAFTINALGYHQFSGAEYASLIIAFILVALLGLLLPLSFFYIFGAGPFKESALISRAGYFNAATRKKYGALFEIYSFKAPWLCFVTIFKRALIAVLFLICGPAVGPVLAAIVSLLYAVFFILKQNPFMDPLSRNLDIAQAVLDVALFIIVAIPGISSSVNLVVFGVITIGIVFLGIIVSIIGYIIATLRQQNIWTVSM